MPELPEVETIRRGLAERLIGQKPLRVLAVARAVPPADAPSGLSSQASVAHVAPPSSLSAAEDTASRNAINHAVSGLRRFGKLLVIDFDNGESLIFHLRMTGQLVYRGEDDESVAGGHPNGSFIGELPDESTRAVFEFEHGKLFFNDQRKFGFYEFLPTTEVERIPFVAKLGPEPWMMTPEGLLERLKRHAKSKIKAVLLDQTVMAGLGNIYADETLYYAGVSPLRLAGDVSLVEAKKIIEGAKASMEASLAVGGSSLKNYVRADGTTGDYLKLFAKAYGREGEKCERCGGEIKKIKVAGRGTHYCPRCQK
jgi:formamidopyrimidine-DNA glycosylase